MLKCETTRIVFDPLQCQQCGVCEPVCPTQAISMELQRDGTHKVIIDNEKCVLCQRCVRCCPANKQEEYVGYFESFPDKKYFLGYNVDEKIRRESSSGGVCKTLVVESLRKGWVDGVYTLKRTEVFPYAEGEFYTKDNIPEYDDMPNSVYHSLLVCRNIGKVQKCKRLMIIGTSCQLRAMSEALKHRADEIIKVCIFCKQQKTLDSTRFLAKVMGAKIPENFKFFVRYRGQGWPGIVRVMEAELPWNRAAQLPFGRRLWTVPGCNVCADPFGTKTDADITLMDPWKIRKANGLGETLITVHTSKGWNLLQQISNIEFEQQTFEAIEPALDLTDVWRKQKLVPFFRRERCGEVAMKAGKAEQKQRRFLQTLVGTLPRMPILLYRVICKLVPDPRNKILK